jgi:hypothetical protein
MNGVVCYDSLSCLVISFVAVLLLEILLELNVECTPFVPPSVGQVDTYPISWLR